MLALGLADDILLIFVLPPGQPKVLPFQKFILCIQIYIMAVLELADVFCCGSQRFTTAGSGT